VIVWEYVCMCVCVCIGMIHHAPAPSSLSRFSLPQRPTYTEQIQVYTHRGIKAKTHTCASKNSSSAL
jgi:hypothetical protein